MDFAKQDLGRSPPLPWNQIKYTGLSCPLADFASTGPVPQNLQPGLSLPIPTVHAIQFYLSPDLVTPPHHLPLKSFPELPLSITTNPTQHNYKYSAPSHLRFLPQPSTQAHCQIYLTSYPWRPLRPNPTILTQASVTPSQLLKMTSLVPIFKEVSLHAFVYCSMGDHTNQTTDFSEKGSISDKSVSSAWHESPLLHLIGIYLQVIYYSVLECHPQLRLDYRI